MANNDQVAQEYLLIKCFLYKYTPEFTAETGVKASLSTFKPYSIDLDDTTYFTKYDISGFVTSYSFEQNIDETTYSWSVDFMDQALSYSTINGLKVKPPVGSPLTGGLSFSQYKPNSSTSLTASEASSTPLAISQGNTDSLNLLSQYEANANTFPNNDPTNFKSNNENNPSPTLPIWGAKRQRGLTPSLLTTQNTNLTNVLSTVPGLRLSDLIQEYDFISVFLYKNTTPLTNIWGNFIPAPSSIAPKNNPLVLFQYITTTDIAPFGLQNPTDPYLKYESVLLTKIPLPNGKTKTLFSNEFNGFVMKKSVTSTINQVDRVTVAGNGWSRLFGSTRRAVKPSLFQNSLYQAGQVLGLGDVSAMETVYAGNSISSIIQDLFDLVYRIDFNITGISGISDTLSNIDTSTVDNSQNGTNLTFTTTTTSSAAPSTVTPTVIPAASDFEVNVSNGTVSGLPLQATAFTSPITTKTQTSVTFTPTSSLNQLSTPFNAPEKITVLQEIGNSFYNITSLIVANEYPANLFNLPQYLLSTVMKLRSFAYIEPLVVPATQNFIDSVMSNAALLQAGTLTLSSQAAAQHTATSNPELATIQPSVFQKATQAVTGEQVVNYGGTQPVFFDPQVQNLTAYFQFLATVFESYSPALQTPYEILDHIRSTAFVEIFEQPNGQFIIRSPQYNNVTASIAGRSDIALIRSSNLNILSSSYNETVENLVTKLFTRYTPNIIPIYALQEFGYCDGKLLVQNGLLETTVEANPNAATASISDNSVNNSRPTGIFGWAEYLMEINNAKLKTGSLTCDLDNTIQVGQTFIDETKFKFGYIVGISKQVSVAGTATMSLRLSYVRDAVPDINKATNKIKDIFVDLLPVLTDIEKSFSKGS